MSSNGVNKHTQTKNEIPIQAASQPPIAVRQIAVNIGSPPWSETVLVTPEIAEHWLKSNRHNRDVRKSRVKQYARDMAAGRWLFNTQGIEFATDGSLINGQHRLMAVIQSGVSVQMVVWFNVPPTTRSVIDIGGARSLADTANLTKVQAAVSIAMTRGLGSRDGATKAEQGEFYRRFAHAIDGVVARFTTIRRGITQANVLAAIARASLHLPATDIDQFCDVLKTGMPSSEPRDAAVIKLRDRLLSSNHPGGTTAAREIYGITLSALKAFGEGRALAKLYVASSDPFPLPVSEAE